MWYPFLFFFFFFFLRNQLVRQQREDDTLQQLLTKVMTYNITWEGGYGVPIAIYTFFFLFLLTLSENVQCRISQVRH